jgi:hypothetical protein
VERTAFDPGPLDIISAASAVTMAFEPGPVDRTSASVAVTIC